METKQPEALRLAGELDLWPGSVPALTAAELRRLHAENVELRSLTPNTGEPVAVFHGLVDSGEHGAFNLDMLKMIPRGAKLFTHPAPSTQAGLDSAEAIQRHADYMAGFAEGAARYTAPSTKPADTNAVTEQLVCALQYVVTSLGPGCFGEDGDHPAITKAKRALTSGRAEMAQPQASEPAPHNLPERDPSKPAEDQGLFRKFTLQRTDGSDRPGGKHHGCEYFVLDITHDKHAPAALRAYAASCAATHPKLSADLAARWGAQQVAVPQDERQAFESYSRSKQDGGFTLDRYSDPECTQYVHYNTQWAWEAWKARAAAPQPPQAATPKPCTWTEDADGYYSTGCGECFAFNEGTPAQNKAYFCHHCGGKIEVKA